MFQITHPKWVNCSPLHREPLPKNASSDVISHFSNQCYLSYFKNYSFLNGSFDQKMLISNTPKLIFFSFFSSIRSQRFRQYSGSYSILPYSSEIETKFPGCFLQFGPLFANCMRLDGLQFPDENPG